MNCIKQLAVCLLACLLCAPLIYAQKKLPKKVGKTVPPNVNSSVLSAKQAAGNPAAVRPFKTISSVVGSSVKVQYHQPRAVSPQVEARLKQDVQRALNNGSLQREELLKAAKTPLLTAGPEGYTLSVPGEPREVVFSELPQLPQLPNGAEAGEYVKLLGVNRGKTFLKYSLDTYMPKFEGSEALKRNIEAVYQIMVEENGSNKDLWAFSSMIDVAIDTAHEEGVLAADVTKMSLYEQAPNMFRMFGALSFREYMVLHGASFPKYGEDNLLDVYIHGLWRRAITGELPMESAQVLVESFMAGSDRGIAEILHDAQVFAQKNGRLPGINVLAMSQQKVVEFTKAEKDMVLSAEEKEEVSLGMELVLVTKMISAAGTKITDAKLPPLIEAYGQLIDQEVAQMSTIAE